MVVPNAADGFLDDLDGYVEPDPYKNHPAAFVPSKVPARRIPRYMNILIHEHHITPHMHKVNLISKFNIVPDQELVEIKKFLDIDIWTVKSEEKWKLTLEEILTLKVKKVNFDFKCIFCRNCDFLQNCDIFALKCFSSKFQDFCEIVMYVMC